MNDEKIPELEIEQTEVEPLDLPAEVIPVREQQDFGKDPAEVAKQQTEEKQEAESNDSGKFPRATKRRSHTEEQKKLKLQRQQMHKMMQESQRPLRRGDLYQIIQQIFMMLQPRLDKINNSIDELKLMPDYIAQCLTGFTVVDVNEITLPSMEGFDEYVTEYKRLLEEEAKAAEEAAKAEANQPQTEEVQKEEV